MAVLGADYVERVQAEIGLVGARAARVGAGAAVGGAVCGGKVPSCVPVGSDAKARDLERVTGPAAAELVVPKRGPVGAAGKGGNITAAAAASAGAAGREHAPGNCEGAVSAKACWRIAPGHCSRL